MNVLVRVDASVEMGAGHAMRTLALCQELIRRGHDVRYLLAEAPPWLIERLLKEKLVVIDLRLSCEPGGVEDAEATLTVCEDGEIDWLIVDGYHFSEEFLSRLSQGKSKILYFDDHGVAKVLPVEVVLNQNAYASDSMYAETVGFDRVFAGVDYCLIRDEFQRVSEADPSDEKGKIEILISLGGIDPLGVSIAVFEALLRSDQSNLSVTVVSSNDKVLEELGEMARAAPHCEVNLLGMVDDMGGVLSKSNFVFTAAGSTVWECSYLGVPFAFVVSAENQVQNGDFLMSRGWGSFLGDVREGVPDEFRDKVELTIGRQKARSCLTPSSRIDGLGRERVVDYMETMVS